MEKNKLDFDRSQILSNPSFMNEIKSPQIQRASSISYNALHYDFINAQISSGKF